MGRHTDAGERNDVKRRAHGEGSIYRLGDGRWRAALDLGWEAGKRKRKYFHGHTQDEVRRKLGDYERALSDGRTPAPERLTVGRYLDDWLEEVVRPAKAPKTTRTYEGIVRVHLKPSLGHTRLRALAPLEIQRMLNAKAAAGLSRRTVQMIREVLRNALRGAVRMGYLPRNPAEHVSVPVPQRRRVRPFTVRELEDFLDAAPDDRLGALFVTVVGLGLRQGEALGLRWEDIDFDAGLLAVDGALKRVGGRLQRLEPKTVSSRRRLPMPDFVASELQRHRVRQLQQRLLAGSRWVDSGYVFTTTIGSPLDGPAVTKQLHRFLRNAGLPDMRFHDLRHQFASLLLAGGESVKVVSELLGHQDGALTLRTYSHVLPDAMRQAVHRMDVLVGPREAPLEPLAANLAAND